MRGRDPVLPGCGGTSTLSEGQLPPRVGSTSLSQSATSRWRWDFQTVLGSINPGDHRFRLRVVVVVDVRKDF